jgi:gluconolactonase
LIQPVLTILLVAALATIAAALPAAQDDGLKTILAEGARVEKVAGGYKFTEGPVWHREGYLLFSDIPSNQILKLDREGKVTVFREPSGNANGNTYDRQGRLLSCEHGNRRVSRTERDGTITTVADRFEGKRLNSPNDIVVRRDGQIYFTDPPYGIRPQDSELGFWAAYRLDRDGKLHLIAKDFERPNGIAFSPDEKRLYVNDTQRNHIRVFAVKEDGSTTGGEVWAVMKAEGREGGADGMKVDRRGNVYCTGPGGVWVFSPQGKHLGTIVAPEVPANVGFGDDGRTLYMTARTGLYKVRLRNPGILPGPPAPRR